MAAKTSRLALGSLRDFCPKKNLDNNRSMELDVCEIDLYPFQSNSRFADKENES